MPDAKMDSMTNESTASSGIPDTISRGKSGLPILISKRDRRGQIIRTLLLYTGFLCLGLIFTIVGPTLLELQRMTGTTTEAISWIFPVRSVIGLFGAVLAGTLINRLNHWMLLCVMMIDIGVCHLLIPHMHNLIALCTVCGFSRMGASFVDAGGNIVLLKLWKEDNGPWMQALHCIFGIGAFLAPLLAEPFLRDVPDGFVSQNILNPTDGSIFEGHLQLPTNVTMQTITENTSISENKTIEYTDYLEYESSVHWVYLILAIFAFTSSALFISIAIFCSEIKLQCKNKPQKHPNNASVQEVATEKEDRTFRNQIISLVFFFYLVYCILEMNFGNYLTVFAVKELGWSEADGAQVTSGYWATFTAGRALGIILVKLLAPWIMLTGSLVIGIISLGVLLFFFRTHYLVLWGCSVSLGLGLSTMYATGITWTEQYITVTGLTGAIFMIGSSIGEMIGPVVIGFLFEKFGPKSFLYVMGCAVCIVGLTFGVMQCHAGRHGKRKDKVRIPEEEMLHLNELSRDGHKPLTSNS